MKYIPTIGLEIHAELKTKTKMFCGCLNDPNESHPNVNICPICMGHPGTLPAINKEAVKKVLAAGKALNGKLAGFSRFDRKNYFYPDLPKGYQISQYKYPLVDGGELLGVRITRIHLEEDAGKLLHAEGGSLADFNRAGMPLMELVTEPDIKSGEEAASFAKELRLILRYLGVSDADMEKGQMRVEANISVKPSAISRQPSEQGGESALMDNSNGQSIGHSNGQASSDAGSRNGTGDFAPLRTVAEGNSTGAKISGSLPLGTKVEVKNLNSFRAAERAINYEIKRQAEILEGGGKITHETRGWDEDKQETFSQRKKEESHDYRYFPEPDLPPLDLAKLDFAREITLPELPSQKRERFKREFGLTDEQIEIFIRDKNFSDYFEEVAGEVKNWDAETEGEDRTEPVKLAANYMTTDLHRLMKEKMLSFGELMITPENFAELVNMINKGEINSRAGKNVLKIMVEEGGDPSVIVNERGLKQMGGEAELGALADKIIGANAEAAEEYKKGKEASLQFLIGQAMKESKGSANPEALKEILIKKLK